MRFGHLMHEKFFTKNATFSGGFIQNLAIPVKQGKSMLFCKDFDEVPYSTEKAWKRDQRLLLTYLSVAKSGLSVMQRK